MKKNKFLHLALMSGLAFSGLGAAPGGQGEPAALVIDGATLIDGTGAAPVPDSVVVIRGNRIVAAGRRGQVARPANARVIQAAGKYLVPGLIDAKANYASNMGEAYLIWGVTSAIWSGGGGDAGIAERDAINHGMIRGPRLFVSFAAISGPGPGSIRRDNGIPGRYAYVVKSPEEARDLAVKFFDAGADFISAGDGNGSPELFKAIVDEAHKRGKAAVMRTVGPETAAKECADMGCDVVIHTGQVGNQITTDATREKWKDYIALPPDQYSDMDDAKVPAMVQYLVSRKLALEPDVIATGRGFPKNWARNQHEARTWHGNDPALLAYYPKAQMSGYIENTKSVETYLTPAQIDVRRRGFHNFTRFLKAYVDAGGVIVPASDIPQSPPGLGLHQEMASFAEDIGMTPMQVIQSATGQAADAFKLKDLGRIQAGKLADIVITDADPTKDILNLRKISTVIKDGKVVDRTYHANYLDTTFRAGLISNGGCCFSSPVIEGYAYFGDTGWVPSLKRDTWRPDAINGEYLFVGGIDSEGAATPGIEAMKPWVVTQGSVATTVTVTGFNFVRGSKAYLAGRPLATQVVSRTELRATVPAATLAKAGSYPLVVKNPQPIMVNNWGDTSNRANLLVPYPFTTAHSHSRF